MTVQDIKKALEICSEDDGCRECPYYDYHHCDKVLLKDALTLITEQVLEQNQKYQEQKIKQAQIDVLNRVMTYINDKIENDYGDMSDSVNYLTIDIDDFDDFIDELIKEL